MAPIFEDWNNKKDRLREEEEEEEEINEDDLFDRSSQGAGGEF